MLRSIKSTAVSPQSHGDEVSGRVPDEPSVDVVNKDNVSDGRVESVQKIVKENSHLSDIPHNLLDIVPFGSFWKRV